MDSITFSTWGDFKAFLNSFSVPPIKKMSYAERSTKYEIWGIIDGKPIEYSLLFSDTTSKTEFDTYYKPYMNTGDTTVKTEVQPRLISGSTARTITSHDFGEITTWYQQSVLETDVVCTTADNTDYDTGKSDLINIDDLSLSFPDGNMIIKDAHEPDPGNPCPYCGKSGMHIFCDRPFMRVDVKKNNISLGYSKIQYTADRHKIQYVYSGNDYYEVNFSTGHIIFSPALTGGDTVKATFRRVNGSNAYRSSWRIRPYTQILQLEKTEIQFHQGLQINDTVAFEIWGGTDPAHYALTENSAYWNSALNGYRMQYRSTYDFVNMSNQGKGVIPAFGGTDRGNSTDILVVPFEFAQSITLDSDAFMTLQCYFLDNIAYGGFATLTFWCIDTPK